MTKYQRERAIKKLEIAIDKLIDIQDMGFADDAICPRPGTAQREAVEAAIVTAASTETITRKKQAATYRAAAQYIESMADEHYHMGACNAIWKVQSGFKRSGRDYSTPEHDLFERFYPWNTKEAEFSVEPYRDDLRILALCFMAAMVEAGDA